MERRCGDAGVVHDPPAAGESSNDRRGRILRLARLVAAPGEAAQATGWAKLECRCRAAGVRCSQQATYPTAATRPGLTAKQRTRGKADIKAAKRRTQDRLRARSAVLVRLHAADEAGDDGAGSLDLAYQLHVAPRRPPGMPDDQDDSMSDSGEVELADRLTWGRGGWLRALSRAPPAFPRPRATCRTASLGTAVGGPFPLSTYRALHRPPCIYRTASLGTVVGGPFPLYTYRALYRPPCIYRAVHPELYCVHAARPVRRRPVLRHAAAA